MNLPEKPGLIVSFYSFLRSVGILNYDEETSERVRDFLALYKVADGKTPLCVCATLYRKGISNDE